LVKDTNFICRFVKKWEFKGFFIYAIFSVVTYPLVQWPFVNNKNPLLVVVIPQFFYAFELLLASVLFLVVIYRMKTEKDVRELMKIAPMIKALVMLIYLLIFFDISLALSIAIINGMYLGYENAPAAQHAITLGVWEFLQCVFLINQLSVVITICFILNVGQVSRLIEGRGLASKSSSNPATASTTASGSTTSPSASTTHQHTNASNNYVV